jgi:hypothetical protein
LEYSTQTIVAATLTLAARRQGKTLKLAASDSIEWYQTFSISPTDVEDVIHQILELYSPPNPLASFTLDLVE